MEMYAAQYPHGYDFPISTLFWGALIFVALFVSCLVVGKAIGRVRNRRKVDGGAAEGGHTKDPRVAQTLADIWDWDLRTGMASMTPRETDEFPPIDQTRKQRKAREKAHKHQNKS
jgi:hypothetical protein